MYTRAIITQKKSLILPRVYPFTACSSSDKDMDTSTLLKWGIYFSAALICQFAGGPFPCPWFSFPIDIAVLAVWGALLWVAQREKSMRSLTGWLTNRTALFTVLGVCALTCLSLGLTRHPEPSSWWFVALFVALISQLWLILLRGWRRGRWRFILIHCGLLLTLVSGFMGGADAREWRMAVTAGTPTHTGYTKDGQAETLPNSLQLIDARTDFYDGSQTPREYAATLRLDDKQTITLRVGHPYAITMADNLYLVGLDTTASGGVPVCIVSRVHEPWSLAMKTGIITLMAGCLLLFAGGPRKGETERRNQPC